MTRILVQARRCDGIFAMPAPRPIADTLSPQPNPLRLDNHIGNHWRACAGFGAVVFVSAEVRGWRVADQYRGPGLLVEFVRRLAKPERSWLGGRSCAPDGRGCSLEPVHVRAVGRSVSHPARTLSLTTPRCCAERSRPMVTGARLGSGHREGFEQTGSRRTAQTGPGAVTTCFVGCFEVEAGGWRLCPKGRLVRPRGCWSRRSLLSRERRRQSRGLFPLWSVSGRCLRGGGVGLGSGAGRGWGAVVVFGLCAGSCAGHRGEVAA
ncbi:hypothetical protein CLV40_1041 [Actinokineospora auranticolor]|uniref:Uncharacterized protein n=1 Tax=Actinokineospora auranticolor TaxID=155976 RepID=A0A2S6GUF8_9PSEU|nr:hypothetical protein CLV40_1041 [Actinokineospora auranticolor]